MDIAVTGSSGLIGTRLVAEVEAAGHRVLRVVRPQSAGVLGDSITWDPMQGDIDAGGFEGLDAVIHLAGEGIGDKRWTPDQKRRIRESRTAATDLLARTLRDLTTPPSVFLSGSAIGWYADTGATPTDETGTAGADFPAIVARDWEVAAQPAVESDIRVVFLRTGVVLATEGGALAKQLPFFRFGLGGRSGPGTQYLSWITIDDEVSAIVHLLTADMNGPANLTAPNPITNKEFTKALGAAVHRPTTVLPMFGPRLLYGRELADSLLLTSLRIVPRALQRSGFTFAHPEIGPALSALLA